MRVEFWAGPHDGLERDIPNGLLDYKFPVPVVHPGGLVFQEPIGIGDLTTQMTVDIYERVGPHIRKPVIVFKYKGRYQY